MSVAAIFEGWQKTQAHLIHRVPKLGPQELQLKASPDGWPVWAIVSQSGADGTPFPDPLDGEGWEDHLDVPRRPDELEFAVKSSGQIVESCLARWTPEMLGETFTRDRAGQIQLHTRQSVLTRLVMHDAFHCGEVSSLLGAHGFASMDPWEPIS